MDICDGTWWCVSTVTRPWEGCWGMLEYIVFNLARPSSYPASHILPNTSPSDPTLSLLHLSTKVSHVVHCTAHTRTQSLCPNIARYTYHAQYPTSFMNSRISYLTSTISCHESYPTPPHVSSPVFPIQHSAMSHPRISRSIYQTSHLMYQRHDVTCCF